MIPTTRTDWLLSSLRGFGSYSRSQNLSHTRHGRTGRVSGTRKDAYAVASMTFVAVVGNTNREALIEGLRTGGLERWSTVTVR